jgi:hypothetical protein
MVQPVFHSAKRPTLPDELLLHNLVPSSTAGSDSASSTSSTVRDSVPDSPYYRWGLLIVPPRLITYSNQVGLEPEPTPDYLYNVQRVRLQAFI